MNIELVCNNYTVPFTDLEWGGSAEQVCRTVNFSVPWNPYDSNFSKFVYKVGDLVYLFIDKSLKFAGMVTDAEQRSQKGTISYTAKDYMYHLIKSSGTYNFKNTTAEAIAKKICNEIGISYKNVYSTGINIKTLLVQNITLYDIIMKAYTIAAETDGNLYMPLMDGNKFTVIKRGQDCGLTLNTKNDITSSSYKQNIDNMVNQVLIFNDKNIQYPKGTYRNYDLTLSAGYNKVVVNLAAGLTSANIKIEYKKGVL